MSFNFLSLDSLFNLGHRLRGGGRCSTLFSLGDLLDPTAHLSDLLEETLRFADFGAGVSLFCWGGNLGDLRGVTAVVDWVWTEEFLSGIFTNI